jgi:urease accessory protein
MEQGVGRSIHTVLQEASIIMVSLTKQIDDSAASARNSPNKRMQNNSLVTLAALHLASPALPIGGFAYSQGLEQAIEDRLVHDAQTAQIWIHDILMFSLAKQELVLWIGAHDAVSADDIQALDRINTEILSLRETREFRLESRQMGQSLAKLFPQWPEAQHFIQQLKAYPKTIALTYTAAFAAICAASKIPLELGLTSYLWGWAENQVVAAVKQIPLGQSAGQAILHELKKSIPEAIAIACNTPADELGSAAIGLAITSARHENQYSRLFRS